MLIQFRFKNYKSFKDDTILDLSATKITEHNSRVVKVGNEKLLSAAAIFGANASGKSNVIEAFRFMMTYVIQSFAYGGGYEDKGIDIKTLKQTPFLFDTKSRDEESLFEVYFITSEENGYKSYNYGFTLNHNGVAEEWLNYKSKTARDFKPIFYRSETELDLSGIPTKSQENIKIALEKEVLILSLGAKLKIAKLKLVRDWFLKNNCANFGNPFENVLLSRIAPDKFDNDRSVQKKVIDYLSAFDPSIVDFNVENQSGDDFEIYAVHKMIDSKKTVSIPLGEESDGTLKMFALYPAFQDTLENGGVLLVDELNARLHPLLVRNFLIAFLDPKLNLKNAQIIFTTHDSWELSNNLLRRDEIWFTEKDPNGVSTLYSLADFVDETGTRIRKDENYEKNYLIGKYGAIPKLKYFDMFGEN